MATTRLFDSHANKEVECPHPSLTAEDVLAFCEYFKVRFYSLQAQPSLSEDVDRASLFRVATDDYPSRGLDITWHSVESWKEGMKSAYREAIEGDVVELKGVGEVTIVGVALALEDGPRIVIFKMADGMPRYLAAARFTGMSYNRGTDTYTPNAVRVR